MKVQLTADSASQDVLNRFNAAEFSELLSSIATVGVPELFVLYDDLKTTIVSGTAKFITDLDIPQEYHTTAFLDSSGKSKFGSVLAYSVNSPNFSLPQSVMLQVGEHDTTSYLFQSSLKYVSPVSRSMEYLFTNVVDQFKISESINSTLISLNAELSSLKYQHSTLVETLKSLTQPNSFNGFQIVPDIIKVIRGQSIKTAITGGYEPFSDPIFDNPASAAALSVKYGKDELVRELTITPAVDAASGSYYFRIEDAQGVSDLVAVNVKVPEGEQPPKTGPLAVPSYVSLTLDADYAVPLTDGVPPFTLTEPPNLDVVYVSLTEFEDEASRPWRIWLEPRGIGTTQFVIEDKNGRRGSIFVKVKEGTSGTNPKTPIV